MIIAGLTGKYCAGKNTVASIFEEKGFLHIDVDKLGHDALPRVKDRIVSRFGDGILDGDEIDRKKLGRIVFSDLNEKKALEEIIHPCMVEMVKERISENRTSDILINAAILHQMQLDRLCSVVIWVDAPILARVRRALKRDSLPPGEILKRIRIQRNLKANLMKKNSDTYIIRNSGDLDKISASVGNLIEKLKEGNR